ncbi:MAG: tetratricopeptide repeat protein [Polyangiales bacterium]
MPDFGFEPYAFEDPDSGGASHPLEIARDLIDSGKPRSALDVLADHHQRHSDDVEYLMLCGQAWFSAGDSPRAQHALLGAARVAPRDPRPLRLLGELLLERGETERARRLFRKAERLENSHDEDPEPIHESVSEAPDLIAFAEHEERTRRTPMRLRPMLLGIGVVVGLALLMWGIDRFASPTNDAAVVPPDPAPAPAVESAPVVEVLVDQQQPVVPTPTLPTSSSSELPMIERAPMILVEDADVLAPAVENPKTTAVEVVPRAPQSKDTTPRAARKKTRAAKREAPTTSVVAETPAAVFDAEIAAGTSANAMTSRGHALVAQGQPSAAARFYRRALEIDPDYAPALVAMGRSLLRAEKYSEAMRNATRALQFARGVDAEPGLEAEALYQMGRVRHQRGEEDAARQLLRQSTSLPKAPPEAWFYLGESLSRDNSPAARDAYEQYLERRPAGHLSGRARRAIQ